MSSWHGVRVSTGATLPIHLQFRMFQIGEGMRNIHMTTITRNRKGKRTR